jgi:hypothetical protein
MFSINGRLRGSVIALACALGFAGTAAAQTIVISASGPSARSYPAGKMLAPGSRIVLAAGDTLTLLDNRGTRTLHGPVKASAEATATTANPSFAALVATQNRRRARTGAIRGASVPPRPSNLWYIDVASEGTVCLPGSSPVELWRPDMEQAASLTVTQESGPSGTVSFGIGQNAAAWPANVPIAEGRSYVLSGADLARPMHVRFALLPAQPGDPASTYAALATKGCAAQKELLIGALQTP